MEILKVTPANKFYPTMITFAWNNGKKAYIGFEKGQLNFFNLTFDKEYQVWRFVTSNYKPNESIMKAVANMVIKYSRSFIQEKLNSLNQEYEKYKKMITGNYERFEHDKTATRYRILNLERAQRDIELFEKCWVGEKHEKVC